MNWKKYWTVDEDKILLSFCKKLENVINKINRKKKTTLVTFYGETSSLLR